MSQVKNMVQGFFLASSAICAFFTFAWLPVHIGLGPGLALFLIVIIPFVINLNLQVKKWRQKNSKQPFSRVESGLMALYGTAFACWFLDIVTTVFVINVRAVGAELNPLGWPYGIIGAAVYYVPASFGVYFLLYRVKTKGAVYGAIVLTTITLFMASMNLAAGINNFRYVLFPTTTNSISGVITFWLATILILTAINIANVIQKRKTTRPNKPTELSYPTGLN